MFDQLPSHATRIRQTIQNWVRVAVEDAPDFMFRKLLPSPLQHAQEPILAQFTYMSWRDGID